MFRKVKESINCKYCNSKHTVCCGIKCGKQRYKCKDCGKSFCEVDNRIMHDYKERQFVCFCYIQTICL
jgi:transposase-like protein